MTGYLLLTNGDASFARSGPLAMTRASRQSKSQPTTLSHALRGELIIGGRRTSRPCGGKGAERRTRELPDGPRVSFRTARIRIRLRGGTAWADETRQNKRDSPPGPRPAVSKPLRMPLSSNEI